jgi:hypothetical protein
MKPLLPCISPTKLSKLTVGNPRAHIGLLLPTQRETSRVGKRISPTPSSTFLSVQPAADSQLLGNQICIIHHSNESQIRQVSLLALFHSSINMSP